MFRDMYGRNPSGAAFAPGRVEVLGNHTDYNGGYVLSAAIDKGTYVLAARQGGDTLTLDVLADANRVTASLSSIKRNEDRNWSNYLLGVIDQILTMRRAPKLSGMLFGVHGDVPIGAGLSSSAALEVATALAIQELFPFEVDSMGLAQMCQRAENDFVGVKCGLLDQFSSVFGRKDHLLFLDCLTLEYDALPIGGNDVTLVVCDCMVKHELTGGEYNERRAQCESAASKLGKKLLRDVTPDMLEMGKELLTEVEYKRARHIVLEDERVLEARAAILAGNIHTLGRLMTESHESSRDYFENSTPELDRLSEIARELPGCYGARLTGGGFGGSVLSLVESGKAREFGREIAARYAKTIDQTPHVFLCRIGNGAHTVPIG
jgi:galactokinase